MYTVPLKWNDFFKTAQLGRAHKWERTKKIALVLNFPLTFCVLYLLFSYHYFPLGFSLHSLHILILMISWSCSSLIILKLRYVTYMRWIKPIIFQITIYNLKYLTVIPALNHYPSLYKLTRCHLSLSFVYSSCLLLTSVIKILWFRHYAVSNKS